MNKPKELFEEATELTREDFQQMLMEKQRELNEALEANNRLMQEKNQMASRALKVHEENRMMQANPDLAAKMAEMEYHLKMAQQFVASGAFPKMTPEQCYTVMKAGAEMGMKEVESLNSLYIVNGQINPHGKAMPARIKQAGYNIEYLNETPQGCDVRVWNEEGFNITEHVDANDPILKQQSRFMKIHPRYKMRYHGLRCIINFHLPHIYGSASDMFAEPVQQLAIEQGNGFRVSEVEESKERKRLERHIENATTLEELAMVQQHVAEYQLSEEYEAKLTQLSDPDIIHPEYEEE